MFSRMTKDTVIKPGDHWWAVTRGMSGWFAVELWMNPGELPHSSGGPFTEPWETGLGRYKTELEAQNEAYYNALATEMPFDLPGFVEPTGLS